MKLELLDDTFAIHRLNPSAEIPDEVLGEAFFNVVRTKEELSIVCRKSLALNSDRRSQEWSCIKVSGPMELNTVGILSKLTSVLADAHISIFAISTYDTDYILIQVDKTDEAVAVLRDAGYQFK